VKCDEGTIYINSVVRNGSYRFGFQNVAKNEILEMPQISGAEPCP
jgi:hypothetical protein